MVPVKVSKEKLSRSPPHTGPIRRLSSTEKLASFEKEWKVVATELVSGEIYTSLCYYGVHMAHGKPVLALFSNSYSMYSSP